MVWEAYQKVRSNQGSAGVDAISMQEFDTDRSKHLNKLWNRMASGSYFPPTVKEVEISKKDGSVRKLGIPTISDKVGQMVVKMFIEPRLEEVFSPNSYGFRPNRNAHQCSRLDLYDKSRMMGDYHVRFCERLGVKLPLLTRRRDIVINTEKICASDKM